MRRLRDRLCSLIVVSTASFHTRTPILLANPDHDAIMSDRWITRMAAEHGMIEPFEDRQVRKGVISYGVSSYGYDMRVRASSGSSPTS